MILRDGRGQTHDLGPSHTFEPSQMPMLGTRGTTPDGETWLSMSNRRYLFVTKNQPTNQPKRLPAHVELLCDECGKTFLARHASLARFCGGTCRKRSHRKALRASEGPLVYVPQVHRLPPGGG